MKPHRRNPFRLIVKKETQLQILWLICAAVFVSMGLTWMMIAWIPQGIWSGVLMIALGLIVSLWTSRRIAGPLYRIEAALEAILSGASEGKPIRVREHDPLKRLTGLINRLFKERVG